jgi:histidinol phosphatase-like enzyme
MLAEGGFTAAVVSRQVCEDDGGESRKALDGFTRRMMLEVALSGGRIGRVYYCTHREDDRCNCFQPGAGIFGRIAREHGTMVGEAFFVGEEHNELRAADTAGFCCVRIEREAFLREFALVDGACGVASSLYEAAELIVGTRSQRSAPTSAGTAMGSPLWRLDPSSLLRPMRSNGSVTPQHL